MVLNYMMRLSWLLLSNRVETSGGLTLLPHSIRCATQRRPDLEALPAHHDDACMDLLQSTQHELHPNQLDMRRVNTHGHVAYSLCLRLADQMKPDTKTSEGN
jgi:hypothetical protein